ncbi:endoglucanase, partial [Streptomyces violaceoruber]
MYGSRPAGNMSRRRAASAAALGAAALLLAGCSSSGDGDDKAAGAGITQQPKETDPFWVNPDGNAAQQVASLADAGKKDQAEEIRKIAQQPTGEW